MAWRTDGNLACDTCPEIFEFPGPRVIVISSARAHGWHIFQGPSLTGSELNKYICQKCMGSNRSRLPAAPPPLEEDQVLFEGP